MASIQRVTRGKQKLYRLRWREPGGEEKSQYFPDHKSAQGFKLEVENRLAKARQQLHAASGTGADRIDLREILTAFLRDSTRINKKSTAEGHARGLDIFLRFLTERYGERKLYPPRLLPRSLLADFYDWLEIGQFGKVRKITTKRRIINVIELAWAWGVDDDAFVDVLPRPRRLRMPRDAAQRTIAPTWTEMDAAIHEANGWQKCVLIMLRFTGLRVQQVMQLKWDDVDLDRMTLRIRGELGKSQQERQGRTVPISEHLVHELAGWGRREEWLVPSQRKQGPRHRQARARDAKRAWVRAHGRPEAYRQPHHAFRKGFISELKRSGADSDAVEFLVGHSLGLRGVYTDPDALPLREAVALIPPLGVKEEKVISVDRERKNNRKTG